MPFEFLILQEGKWVEKEIKSNLLGSPCPKSAFCAGKFWRIFEIPLWWICVSVWLLCPFILFCSWQNDSIWLHGVWLTKRQPPPPLLRSSFAFIMYFIDYSDISLVLCSIYGIEWIPFSKRISFHSRMSMKCSQ